MTDLMEKLVEADFADQFKPADQDTLNKRGFVEGAEVWFLGKQGKHIVKIIGISDINWRSDNIHILQPDGVRIWVTADEIEVKKQ